MYRFAYAQGRVLGDPQAGMYPSAYLQHDAFTWVPGDATVPYASYGIGIGCASPDPARAVRYAGERYLSGIPALQPGSPYDEACYCDWAVIHDAVRNQTTAYLISGATSADANFWLRGDDIRTEVTRREMNGAFDTFAVDTSVLGPETMDDSAGGNRYEAIAVSVDLAHRDRGIMLVSEVAVAAWTPVATAASADCDLSGEASYWQTGTLTVKAYECLDLWAAAPTWTIIGTVFTETVAIHPFLHWMVTEYPVMVEHLPDGSLVAAVSYPTSWSTYLVQGAWPRPKAAATPEWVHVGFEPLGQVQQFAVVEAYKTTPWPFEAVAWTPFKLTAS